MPPIKKNEYPTQSPLETAPAVYASVSASTKAELPKDAYFCDIISIGFPIHLTRGRITSIPLVGYEVKKRKLVSTNMAARGLQVINPVLAPGDREIFVIWLDKFAEDAVFKMESGDLQIKLHD